MLLAVTIRSHISGRIPEAVEVQVASAYTSGKYITYIDYGTVYVAPPPTASNHQFHPPCGRCLCWNSERKQALERAAAIRTVCLGKGHPTTKEAIRALERA